MSKFNVGDEVRVESFTNMIFIIVQQLGVNIYKVAPKEVSEMSSYPNLNVLSVYITLVKSKEQVDFDNKLTKLLEDVE